MARLDDLEDRVYDLERTRLNKIVSIDAADTTTLNFVSSSYNVELEIDVMSNDKVTIEIDFNGEKQVFNTNYIYKMYRTLRTNRVTIVVRSGGILSKKIRIEGIGVKLLNI